MSPSVDEQSAGIRVDCPEQSPQRIVKTDDKNSRADRLQIFRHEAHPEFFARADYENGNEQNNKIAFKPQEISKPARSAHSLPTRRLHSA